MADRWRRIAGWAMVVIVAALVLRAVTHEWHALVSQPLRWRIRPLYLLGAVALVLVNYAILIEAWRVVLRGWGERLPYWQGARIWSLSSFGKYVPGKIWAVAGMAMMAQRAGVAAWAATASAVVLQALSIGTGAAVTGIAGATRLAQQEPWVRLGLIALIVASVAGLSVLLWPPITGRLLRLARVNAPPERSPGAGAILTGLAANAVAWILYGLSLWCLAHGLFDVPALDVRSAIAAFTASYVAGLLALFAPGGIGVREGVFLIMLDGVVGPGLAGVLAIASRLMLTLTEVGVATPFLLMKRNSERGAD